MLILFVAQASAEDLIIPFPKENTTPSITPSPVASQLHIDEVVVSVDRQKETVAGNIKIPGSAKENSDISFSITLKNGYDKSIKDIKVTASIDDLDLEDDSSIANIEPGKTSESKLSFELPTRIDDGDYKVTIKATGYDSGNNAHTDAWNSELEVKKERHNVQIESAEFSPSLIRCSETANLDIRLLNLGREDEKVSLKVDNNYLGTVLNEKDIELGSGTDSDADFRRIFPITLPPGIGSATYDFKVTAAYDGRSESSQAKLTIQGCTTEQKLSVKSIPPAAKETLTSTKTLSATRLSYGPSMALALGLVLIVLLGVIIFLLFVFLMLKK